MKGILFTPENVKLCAEGRKTVTRRTHGLEAINQEPDKWAVSDWHLDANGARQYRFDSAEKYVIVKPQYRVGETVYIKEAWRYFGGEEYEYQQEQKAVIYKSDVLVNLDIHKWGSPMFMPEWAARHFRKIIGVRAERLKDITSEDCFKEGIEPYHAFYIVPGTADNACEIPTIYETPQAAYFAEWDMLNGKKDNGMYHSSRNPWLFRYEFQKGEVKA